MCSLFFICLFLVLLRLFFLRTRVSRVRFALLTARMYLVCLKKKDYLFLGSFGTGGHKVCVWERECVCVACGRMHAHIHITHTHTHITRTHKHTNTQTHKHTNTRIRRNGRLRCLNTAKGQWVHYLFRLYCVCVCVCVVFNIVFHIVFHIVFQIVFHIVILNCDGVWRVVIGLPLPPALRVLSVTEYPIRLLYVYI
jgi:hypothetical protein